MNIQASVAKRARRWPERGRAGGRQGALSAWCSAAAVVWLARPRVRASRSRDGGAGNLGVGSRTAAPGAGPGRWHLAHCSFLRAVAGQMAIYQRIRLVDSGQDRIT